MADIDPEFELGDRTETSLALKQTSTAGDIGHVNDRLKVDAAFSAPQPIQIIGSDGTTIIGNTGDKLKVDATVTVTSTGLVSNIYKKLEASVTSKTKYDSGLTYTVPANKSFRLGGFKVDHNDIHTITFRLEKQALGTGAWSVIDRLTIKSQPQEPSFAETLFNGFVEMGVATDVFKVTIDSMLVKGSYMVSFWGQEY